MIPTQTIKYTFYILMGLSFLGLDAEVTLLLFVLVVSATPESVVRGLDETLELFLPPTSTNILGFIQVSMFNCLKALDFCLIF